MMNGSVSGDYEPLVTLVVRSPSGRGYEFVAQIDTGFGGGLTLPPEIIDHLGLTWQEQGQVTLADGTVATTDIYDGIVVWDGRPRSVPIESADVDPLVGTQLLAGHRLTVDFRPGGRVAVTSIPRPPDPTSVRGTRV